jgi:hypothetical protein
MLNKQVKAGMSVKFKHSGQTHSGVVKGIGAGPDPSGAPVTVDQIAPKIEGHPNITVDAGDLWVPAQPVLPTQPPFTAPPGTNANGTPISPRNYYLFCSYADAMAIASGEVAALAKMPNVSEVSMQIVDDIYGSPGYDNPGYADQFVMAVPPSNPPNLPDITIWRINITATCVIPQETPTIPAFTGPCVGSDVAGDMTDREIQPNEMDVGPTGEWGGNTIYMKLFAPAVNDGTNIGSMSGYWNPAQQ